MGFVYCAPVFMTDVEIVSIRNTSTPEDEVLSLSNSIINEPPVESAELSNVHAAFVTQQWSMNIRQSSTVPGTE